MRPDGNYMHMLQPHALFSLILMPSTKKTPLYVVFLSNWKGLMFR